MNTSPKTTKTTKGKLATPQRWREMFIVDAHAGTLINRHDRHRAKAGQRAGTQLTSGYRVVSFDGRTYPEHVAVYVAVTGEYPATGCIIHHRNSIRNDNRFENLEQKRIDLHIRQHKIQNPGTSSTGLKNVYADPKNRRFLIHVMNEGTTHRGSVYWGTDEGRAREIAREVAAKLREHQGPLAEGRHVNDLIREAEAQKRQAAIIERRNHRRRPVIGRRDDRVRARTHSFGRRLTAIRSGT